MYLSIAIDVTIPPFSEESENQSKSVPPPQNETRTGVRLIIIRMRGVIHYSSRQRNTVIKGYA
jgi:hypothetical protein